MPRIHGDIQVRIPVEEVRAAVISRKLSRDVIFISLSNSWDKRNDKSDGNSTCAPMYSWIKAMLSEDSCRPSQ